MSLDQKKKTELKVKFIQQHIETKRYINTHITYNIKILFIIIILLLFLLNLKYHLHFLLI